MKILKSKFNKDVYNERISRTLPFLGLNEKDQEESQIKLSESTVGIAGAGGIGGAMAVRLARFGIKKIKIADPQQFDVSNINRQLGANVRNVGENKAKIVGEMSYDIAGDVDVEIYEEGITNNNAKEFVSGCDLILDQLDFSIISEKYALHKAFREEEKCKCILACSVIGWNSILYKFERNSMPIESWYGINDTSNILDLSHNPKTEKLLKLWSPKFPRYPSFTDIMSVIDNRNFLPIFAGSPPLAEGILTQRVILVLTNKEKEPYGVELPPIPRMYIYDSAMMSGGIYYSDGNISNENEINGITGK